MYSEEFRNEATKKVLLRGSRPFISIAREMGIPVPTLRSWLNRSVSGDSIKKNHFGPKTKKRNAAEKFKILLEAAALQEGALGEYLRKHGLSAPILNSGRPSCLSSCRARPVPRGQKTTS